MFQLFVAMFLTITYERALSHIEYREERDRYTKARHVRRCVRRGFIGMAK